MIVLTTALFRLPSRLFMLADTQTDPVKLAKALAFIAAHHNKTAAAPTATGAAVFVAEYGLAQNEVSNTTLLKTLSTVVDTALAFGCPYVMFWETYDNECTGEIAGCSGGRCHDPANPVTGQSLRTSYFKFNTVL
jgi:hypothetical protein